MRIWLFDIDGTLISSGGAGQQSMADALHTAFGRPADTGPVPFSGRTDRSIAADLFAYHGIENHPENWAVFVDHYLRALPARLASLPGSVLPGVLEMLDWLSRQTDQQIGLLTGNIPRGAQTKLRHFDLDHRFAFGFYGDQYFDRDDVARAAHADLVGRLGQPSGELDIWIIGDTPRDVRCGQIIGARTIAVATGNYSTAELQACRPDVTVETLSQLNFTAL